MDRLIMTTNCLIKQAPLEGGGAGANPFKRDGGASVPLRAFSLLSLNTSAAGTFAVPFRVLSRGK